MLDKFLPPFLFLSLQACGGDSSSTTTAQDIRIPFIARAGDVQVNCGARLKSLGSTKTDAIIQDFRFYLSSIHLLGTDGREYPLSLDESEWQTPEIAMMDFQDRADNCQGEEKTVHTELTGTISEAVDIQGLKFTIGLPPGSNHIDIAQAKGPLNVSSMYWSWQGGYKFMRLDVAPVGGITRTSDPNFSATVYNFHLGSTNCEGSPEAGEAVNCERSNRPVVELADFVPGQAVVLDYAALMKDLNLSLDEAGTPGCMSDQTDPECAKFFQSLALDLNSGNPSDSQQTLFTVESSLR